MTNYRNSKFIERYEDVVYELDTALNLNIANNAHQKKMVINFMSTIEEKQPLLIGITLDSM